MVKRLFVLGVIVFLLGLGASTEAEMYQPSPPPAALRVVSMGLQCPLPTDCSQSTLNSIAATIRAFHPDILLVREAFWGDVGESLIGAINNNTTGYRLNYFEIRPGPNFLGARGGTMIATTTLPWECKRRTSLMPALCRTALSTRGSSM